MTCVDFSKFHVDGLHSLTGRVVLRNGWVNAYQTYKPWNPTCLDLDLPSTKVHRDILLSNYQQESKRLAFCV